jgi:hypothetical protein
MKELLLALLLVGQGGMTPVADGGSISGRVLSIGGLPTTNVVVTFEPEAAGGGPARNATRTDSSGQYRRINIPPGRYYVTVGPADAPIYLPGVANRADAKIFTITSGATFEN